ncbi:MAG: D-alanyl-D-alanine carboxypeptidase family protein [Lachnospiraceae bacterium]|nr:D-alanyl-D-alanine carboxypeptidase family protein [Lachnospiraceae bacterium]
MKKDKISFYIISSLLGISLLSGCGKASSVPTVSEDTISENEIAEPVEDTVSDNDIPEEEDDTPENDDPYFVGYTRNGHTIQNIEGLTYIDGTLIVNKSYPLPEDYDPGDLIPVVNAAFTQMQQDAKAEGYTLTNISGFRSYELQKELYFFYVRRNGGIDVADCFSARPGFSEHQTGMAMDLNSCLTSFGDSPTGIWLKEHCADYGFIIRYPEGKEEITGFIYEPWHIRYVGKELAKELMASGKCLEEYFGIDSAYTEEDDENIREMQASLPSGGGGNTTPNVPVIPDPVPTDPTPEVLPSFIDPVTGFIFNPNTGLYYDPVTYLPIDMTTMQPVQVIPDPAVPEVPAQ